MVILVVAADDGVMPQTVEAINHAEKAGVPLVVAINKCDKTGVDVKKIKEGLMKYNVILEEFGGEVPAVEISALKGRGMTELEETLLTVSEVCDFRGDESGPVEGVIIESSVDKGLGNVATILVQRGTLKIGDIIVAGGTWCKVRLMTDEHGLSVKEAGPSTPMKVCGWKELPGSGDVVLQVKGEDRAKEVTAYRDMVSERKKRMQSVDEINDRRAKEREIEESEVAVETDKSKILPLIVKGTILPR